VLRNRQLLVAANRYVQCARTITHLKTNDMNTKNWLLRNKEFAFLLQKVKQRILLFWFLLFNLSSNSQVIANFVNNGGFEEFINCSLPALISVAKYWNGIDSLSSGSAYYNTCTGIQNVPYSSFTFQYPRTGQAFVSSNFYCQASFCNQEYNRFYFKNRLKSFLQSGKTYCVKFYVNISNNSTLGIDKFEAYFGNSVSIDTITKGNAQITYFAPQIQNPINNIISDTLNWIPITGTFVANGSEKYMIIGNFKSDALTNTLLINPTFTPAMVCDAAIDDVSCIDIDLPAYAGPDVFCIPGNSVYIGRQRDVGIDEACMWYKLPNITTAIDTAAGIWVSPTATSTYVVRQEICAGIKYDTVVVTMSGLGFDDMYSELDSYFTLSPNPSKDKIELNYKLNDHAKITIQNNLGQIIREEEISFINSKYNLSYTLPNGIYFITILNSKHKPITKKLIVHGK